MYRSYQKSYENFCFSDGVQPFPATKLQLVEWAALRASGSSDPAQGRLKAESIQQGLSAIRAVHVSRFLPTTVFESPEIKLVMAGIRRTQSKREKKKARPLSQRQLQQITSPASEPQHDDWEHVPDEPAPCMLSNKEVDNLNWETAIKLAFAGFLRTAELTYEAKDLDNKPVFQHTKLQRRDITFSDDDDHVILSLRSSKSDYDCTGVEIVISRTGDDTCPVKALQALFSHDPQPPHAPLFRSSTGPFSRQKYINELRRRLRNKGYTNAHEYAGHSPRRGAAQHAADNRILDPDIQKLGRWSSQAFKGYFHISQAYKFALSRRFLIGRSPPIITTSPCGA